MLSSYTTLTRARKDAVIVYLNNLKMNFYLYQHFYIFNTIFRLNMMSYDSILT